MALEFLQTENLKLNNQTSSYVLQKTDSSALIVMNVGSANTVTIPNDATVDFLIGTRICVLQSGTGQTSINGGLGVSINSQGGILSLISQYAMCELIKIASNTWTLQGGIIAGGGNWVDYSATSTIVGWSSFTTKKIRYSVLNKQIYVLVELQGTSNSTTTSFTLPTANNNQIYTLSYALVINNGVVEVGGVEIPLSSSTVTCTRTLGNPTWTNSGSKRVYAQIFYEIA